MLLLSRPLVRYNDLCERYFLDYCTFRGKPVYMYASVGAGPTEPFSRLLQERDVGIIQKMLHGMGGSRVCKGEFDCKDGREFSGRKQRRFGKKT